MSRITGIGGVFINLNGDVKKLLQWYRDVLKAKGARDKYNVYKRSKAVNGKGVVSEWRGYIFDQ